MASKYALSKTTFMHGLQCSKRLWLHKKKPGLKNKITEEQEFIFQQGTDVGIFARELFPGGVDATPAKPWLYEAAVNQTQAFIRQGHQVIYEAAFAYEGIVCAVDLLVKTTKGWIAYEVKSTLSLKPTHVRDAALQYFVINGSGLLLVDMVVIHLNKSYVRKGKLVFKELFYPVTVLERILKMQPAVALRAASFNELLLQDTMPAIEAGAHCYSPYSCDFTGFCNAELLSSPEDEIVKETPFFLPQEYDHLQLLFWQTAIPVKDGQWPYRANCFGFNILHSQEEIVYSFMLQNKFQDEAAVIDALMTRLSGQQPILVEDKNAVLYWFKNLMQINPELKGQLQYLSKKLVEIPAINPEEIGSKRLIKSMHQASLAFTNVPKSGEKYFAILWEIKKYAVQRLRIMNDALASRPF